MTSEVDSTNLREPLGVAEWTVHEVLNWKGKTFLLTTDPARDANLTAFGKATLSDRYLQSGETFQGMFARVAGYFADDESHAQRLYEYISKLWFMPSTPILSNGGNTRGLPISCFLNAVQDSLASINQTFSENMWLAAKGGGIGTDWSSVRSIGERVGQNGKTSGIIPFIHIQNAQTLGVSQGSLRRGSSAAYLDVSHPEIHEFIEIRRPTGGDASRKAVHLHHGVTVSDAFLTAVENDEPWALVSPRTGQTVKEVSARDLWSRILTARIETGEPYILFKDNVNNGRPSHHKKLGLEVTQSNLCAEITLPTGVDHIGNERTAVCCLSSLNLETYEEWRGSMSTVIHDVMCFLDNVLQDFINKTEFLPGFERARYSAMRERSVGLGVMGFHGYLQSRGIPFESAMAEAFNRRFFKSFQQELYSVNVNLALKRGSCPDAEDVCEARRFSNMSAIAPTASISIICGQTSPSIEPSNANSYAQKTLSGTFNVRNKYLQRILEDIAAKREYSDHETAEGWIEEQWSSITINGGSVQHLDYLSADQKDVFKTAFELDQRWVVDHAAARAEYIDQAQSVNIFLTPDTQKRDLHFLHMRGWKKGLKSFYYCRSLSKQRAQKVSHLAGEMPNNAPAYQLAKVDYEMECLSCQ